MWKLDFLTLLESLSFCKVDQNLKCRKWPIWVVGSESHYTLLFWTPVFKMRMSWNKGNRRFAKLLMLNIRAVGVASLV